MSLIHQIQAAQIRAGEDAVIAHLEAQGLIDKTPTTPTPTPTPAAATDDEDPGLLNCQVADLLEGIGASEDHENVLAAWARAGLSPDVALRVHRAVVGYERATPSSRWKINGEPDPHAGQYDGERAALAMGNLTDDELANGAFMNYDRPLDVEAILARKPGYFSPIAWMTAVKERIRWLSRSLERELQRTKDEPTTGNWIAAEDYYRNVKALDAALNGEGGAERPKLIDLLAQVEELRRQLGKPLVELLDPMCAPPPGTATFHIDTAETSSTQVVGRIVHVKVVEDEFNVRADRDDETDSWYIDVTDPTGERTYDGRWHDSVNKTAEEVMQEAAHGSLIPAPAAGTGTDSGPLTTVIDFVERATHWSEGGADRHAAKLALKALTGLAS